MCAAKTAHEPCHAMPEIDVLLSWLEVGVQGLEANIEELKSPVWGKRCRLGGGIKMTTPVDEWHVGPL